MYIFQWYIYRQDVKKSRLRRVMWYFDMYIIGKTQEKMVAAARNVLFSGVKCRQNVKKIAPAAQNILFPSVSYRYHIAPVFFVTMLPTFPNVV